MKAAIRHGTRSLAILGSLSIVTQLGSAHRVGGTGPDHGVGFGPVVATTVAVGFLGGAIVLRRRPTVGKRRRSIPLVALLLVILGGWAAVRAIAESPALAGVVVVSSGSAVWLLRNRVFTHRDVASHATLGVVVLHRVIEGALLAAFYSADVGVGVVAALVLAAHAAGETGAVAGLWARGRSRWGIVTVVQTAFVAGAFGGDHVGQLVDPLTTETALALFGGVMIAAGVVAVSRREHGTTAR